MKTCEHRQHFIKFATWKLQFATWDHFLFPFDMFQTPYLWPKHDLHFASDNHLWKANPYCEAARDQIQQVFSGWQHHFWICFFIFIFHNLPPTLVANFSLVMCLFWFSDVLVIYLLAVNSSTWNSEGYLPPDMPSALMGSVFYLCIPSVSFYFYI